MPKAIGDNPSLEEYWDKRVRMAKNLKDMLFCDGRREQYWANVRTELEEHSGWKALDMCCGWGQFSDIFDDYIGYDFCEGILDKAKERYPDKEFIKTDVKDVKEKAYLIFEVNSLHSMDWTPDEFYYRFKDQADIIACLEADEFVVWTYGEKETTEQTYSR